MCRLCSDDKKEARRARDDTRYTAERLLDLSKDLHRIANGHMHPHTEAAKTVGIRAREAIRLLAQEWC